ncbi:efflux RND transporter periplasmic adaptor subunit [Hymenobacter perfusus]|uniref:Uncharacterized protein n=1 Tax=Hymenobacter perfusus TaxID=1236770 RepID=A0A428K8P5_9BACT|nr:biotin/lipoyl-binding protein [Hymenobacter perfusus]RSK42618.1 hypothetical protein EI293_12515 [Hymenobacter perfusus]
MKKLVGVGFVLFVAASSAVLPLWLTPTDTRADELPATSAQFLAVSQGPAVSPPVVGQPVLARQTGKVHEVYFHEGQHVRPGQLLLKVVERLPSVQQQQLQLRLNRQQAALTVLQQQVPAVTTAELTAAQQQLVATRQLLARQVPMLSFVFVTAPTEGIITSRTAAPGDRLTPQTPVGTLSTELPADTTLLLTSVR